MYKGGNELKKQAFILFLFVLSLSSLTPAAIAEKMDRSPLKITFLGGAPSGVWYMVQNGVTMCISKSYPGSIVTVTPGTNTANVQRINDRQGDCSMAHSTIMAWAAAGQEPYKKKMANLAAVASLYPSHFQLVVLKKLGVTSFDELIAKKPKIRLSVGQPGTSFDLALRQILGEYGVSYEDITAWGGKIYYKDMETSAGMLADGQIDGYALLTLYPAPQIQENALNKDLVLLTIDPAILERVCEKYGYSRSVIPAKAYSFNGREVNTIATYAVVIVPKNGPDEGAYKVARSIYENLGYLRSVHAALADLTPAKLVKNLGVPLHQGALAFYREVSTVKP